MVVLSSLANDRGTLARLYLCPARALGSDQTLQAGKETEYRDHKIGRRYVHDKLMHKVRTS